MKIVRFTISADTTSDAALKPILEWTIRRDLPAIEPAIEFVDYSRIGRPPGGLDRRIKAALQSFPCDVLVVHRDAETQSPMQRQQEIESAVFQTDAKLPFVAVIPIRMTEAWLLFDESTIRHASSNPNGRHPLGLPAPTRWESIPDPKCILHDALKSATGFTGRRLRTFRPERQVHRVAELVRDFSPLEPLDGFKRFRESLAAALHPFCATRP
ncbi:MAG: DUF4276 family protein [Bryobacterales bacterium]|nr:DUF4276 family protein [Bryobacterales bacterium]